VDVAFAADPRDVACLLPAGYGVREKEVNGVSIDMLTVLEQGENPDCWMISTDDTCRRGGDLPRARADYPFPGRWYARRVPLFSRHISGRKP